MVPMCARWGMRLARSSKSAQSATQPSHGKKSVHRSMTRAPTVVCTSSMAEPLLDFHQIGTSLWQAARFMLHHFGTVYIVGGFIRVSCPEELTWHVAEVTDQQKLTCHTGGRKKMSSKSRWQHAAMSSFP
eukprot:876708-Amphidinium_carterae.1